MISIYSNGRFERKVDLKTTCQKMLENHDGQRRFWVASVGKAKNGTLKGKDPFLGMIDEIRISKVARYAAEYEPPARFEVDADTLALYHFDEGQGDVLTDSSGNNHHGKIVNAKWVPGIAGGPPPGR
jgi:hypothetical protein